MKKSFFLVHFVAYSLIGVKLVALPDRGREGRKVLHFTRAQVTIFIQKTIK